MVAQATMYRPGQVVRGERGERSEFLIVNRDRRTEKLVLQSRKHGVLLNGRFADADLERFGYFPVSEQKVPTSVKMAASGQPQARQEVFGFSMTSVIRWMGSRGWTREQAERVLEACNVEPKRSTLKTQLRWGAAGKQEPASLSRRQIEELTALMEGSDEESA